jgi:hypothetical protein
MQGSSSPPSGLAHFAKASCCQRSRYRWPAVFQATISTSLRSVRRSAALQRFKSVTTACGARRSFVFWDELATERSHSPTDATHLQHDELKLLTLLS